MRLPWVAAKLSFAQRVVIVTVGRELANGYRAVKSSDDCDLAELQ